MGKKKKRNKEQPKLGFWETLRLSRGMYRRLFYYIKPYKWRFIGGITFGILYAAANSALPWAMLQVSTSIFHGTMPNPKAMLKHHEMLTTGPQINSIVWICLLIPLVMIVRSIFAFLNAYCLGWVSSRVI